jgi:hypothetical protein
MTSSMERARALGEAVLAGFEALGPGCFEAGSLEIRPGNPAEPVQVGSLSTPETEGERLHAIWAVSDFSDFVPITFTNCEKLAVSSSLLALIETVDQRPAPEIGTAFTLVGSEPLAALGFAGLVLLTPASLGALSDMEVVKVGSDVLQPRLVLYVDAEELAAARTDFWALMQRFEENQRDIFLLR